jgi:hypothetical protein
MELGIEERLRKIELEVQMQAEFNRLLVPPKPARVRQTRWDFDALNAENAALNFLANQAFDAAKLFPIPSTSSDFAWATPKPSITEPHRIGSQPIQIAKQKMKRARPPLSTRTDETGPIIHNVFVPVPTRRVQKSTAPHVHKGPSFDPIDMDSTLDRFVDDIHKFRRW